MMASEFSNGWASQQKKRFVVVLPDEVDVAFMALGEPRGGTETGFTLREDLSFSAINLKSIYRLPSRSSCICTKQILFFGGGDLSQG